MLLENVSLNVEHLKTISKDEFVKSFSTPEAVAGFWPNLKEKERDKFLNDVYDKSINPPEKVEPKTEPKTDRKPDVLKP